MGKMAAIFEQGNEMMKKKFMGGAFAVIHSSAKALHKVGAIDKVTMRDFDDSCRSATPEFTPLDIQK